MIDLAALLKTASLGDERLNRRALTLVGDIIKGQASATHGPEGVGHLRPWAHAMGAFRFFDNDRLTLPRLYEPCRVAVQQLVPQGERCLVVHDVSVLDYSGHQRKEDLSQVGNERGYGYELFTSLVLSAQGNPLGPLMQEVRTMQGVLSSQSPTPLPFVDHLSQMERAVTEADRCLPDRIVVHVCDREFDDLQLLRFIHGKGGRYLIRTQHLVRKVQYQGTQWTLQQVVEQVPLTQVGLVTRQNQTYDLWVGQTQVLFDGKSMRGVAKKRQRPRSGASLPVRVVISELRTPGRAPLRWVLLTNLEDDLLEVVTAYMWRWRVERFFYLNKIGFRLEAWRQETAERIARRLAITQLAALVIYQMQAMAQTDSEAGQLIKDIATLGGWLGRKRDPIGPIVLMRGMLLLLGMMSALEEFGERKLRGLAHKLMRTVGFPTGT